MCRFHETRGEKTATTWYDFIMIDTDEGTNQSSLAEFEIKRMLKRVDDLLERVRNNQAMVPAVEHVPFEELQPDLLRRAAIWDTETQVDRYKEMCYALFWDPTVAQDEAFLRDAIYARTALRVAGMSTYVH
jgi:hypothetical protein